MKRVGYIYEEIYEIDNIKNAIRKASEGKKDHKYVSIILNNEDFYALKIQKMLKDMSYNPSEPKAKIIIDSSSGKIRERYISQIFTQTK